MVFSLVPKSALVPGVIVWTNSGIRSEFFFAHVDFHTLEKKSQISSRYRV